MVVSKRCKICTALHPENIPIAGEYFGKTIPTLVERICGIVLDERKINGVLICNHCVIELVYTDVVIDKLRCSLQRLQKTIKPKTPSKEAHKVTGKEVKKVLNGTVDEETESKTNSTTGVSNLTDVNIQDEKIVEKKTPKKVVRRKSVFPDDKVPNPHPVKTNALFAMKTPKRVVSPKLEPSENSASSNNANAPKFQKIDDKSPLEKSVFLDDKVISSRPVVTNSLFATKTPKKAATLQLDLIEDSSSPDKADAPKFKKFNDNESPTVKKTPKKVAKRKPALVEDALSPDATEDDGDDNQSKKRFKTHSFSATDQSLLNLTIDDQDLDGTNTEEISLHKDNTKKVLNCVICGKSFNKKSSLRDHIDACHMGERLKECPNCSTEFRSQQKYESHVFNEKCRNALHACQFPKCNKRFKTVHKMELHMQDKHSPQNDTDSDN